jgi:hypothetical protein
VAVALKELELTLPGLIVPERMGDLLDDEDDPDACQHPFDDAGRKVVRNDAGPKKGGDQLSDSADDHRQEVGLDPEGFDSCGHHHGEACRRPAHVVPRPTDHGDNDSANKP